MSANSTPKYNAATNGATLTSKDIHVRLLGLALLATGTFYKSFEEMIKYCDVYMPQFVHHLMS